MSWPFASLVVASSVARSSRGLARRSWMIRSKSWKNSSPTSLSASPRSSSLTLQVWVVRREELLREFQNAIFVGFVDSEDRRENAKRVALRDFIDEVALALLAQRVDQLAGAFRRQSRRADGCCAE